MPSSRKYVVLYHDVGSTVVRVIRVEARNQSTAIKMVRQEFDHAIVVLGTNVNAPQSELDVRIERFTKQLELSHV